MESGYALTKRERALSDNTATNIRWLALVTGGEGLHNNHHGSPRSAKFSLRAGEIDPSWPIIQLLTRMKLARACQPIERAVRA
jgi:fatty-acid desaturase